MATPRTLRYLLNKLLAGGAISDDGYKVLGADRDLVDFLLYLGAEGHRHDGATELTSAAPATGAGLEIVPGAGSIPGGRRVYYKYTLVSILGLESMPSPEVFIDTPAGIAEPGSPSLIKGTAGTLPPGPYYYVLSAWRDSNTLETRAVGYANTTLFGPTSNGSITITFPSVPSGADGFNIYRRAPGENTYHFLASVDLNVATPPTAYIDDGSVAEDCNRTFLTANRTAASTGIRVSMPGATPVVPIGYTWRVYRTYVSGDYTNAFVAAVVEETSEGSGVITPTFLDLGYGTQTISPPTSTVTVGSPDKVNLADGAEVQGSLPMGLTAHADQVIFTVPGTLNAPMSGVFVWVCPFPLARVIGVQAALGIGSVPVSADVIFDVNKGPYDPDGIPVYATMFTTAGNRPRVAAGRQIGVQAAPNSAQALLVKGDALSVDLDQDGGSGTPTDRDATIVISIIAYGYPTTSFDPDNPGPGY